MERDQEAAVRGFEDHKDKEKDKEQSDTFHSYSCLAARSEVLQWQTERLKGVPAISLQVFKELRAATKNKTNFEKFPELEEIGLYFLSSTPTLTECQKLKDFPVRETQKTE